MCNRYANRIAYRQYLERLKAAKVPLVSPSPDRAPNLEPRENIFPTELAPVLRGIEGGLELAHLRWGLIPSFHKSGIKDWKMLTTNARSETIDKLPSFCGAFAKRRCLVPLDQFYEWTGPKGKKTKWGFTRRDEQWFCFAGIWDRAQTSDGVIDSYALVTVPAGPDVAPYHDREPIMLEPAHYARWLESPSAAAELFKPALAGQLVATAIP